MPNNHYGHYITLQLLVLLVGLIACCRLHCTNPCLLAFFSLLGGGELEDAPRWRSQILIVRGWWTTAPRVTPSEQRRRLRGPDWGNGERRGGRRRKSKGGLLWGDPPSRDPRWLFRHWLYKESILHILISKQLVSLYWTHISGVCSREPLQDWAFGTGCDRMDLDAWQCLDP